MRIYVLQEYNAGMTVCISEDIGMIRSQICSKNILIRNGKLIQSCPCGKTGKRFGKLKVAKC